MNTKAYELSEHLYSLANDIDSNAKSLPDEWQDWIREVSGELRNAVEVARHIATEDVPAGVLAKAIYDASSGRASEVDEFTMGADCFQNVYIVKANVAFCDACRKPKNGSVPIKSCQCATLVYKQEGDVK